MNPVINIGAFRKSAISSLARESALRIVLEKENDELSLQEFLVKFPIWWELAGSSALQKAGYAD